MMAVELYSGVELTEALNGYPKGTEGHVVEILDDEDVLVELFDAEGNYHAVEDVPIRYLKPAAV